jgi:hypothetical protein
METIEFLRAWRTQIDTPKKWTRGCAARLANDTPCLALDRSASKWCLLGAYAVAGRERNSPDALRRVERFTPNSRISAWNDAPGRTHAEVMALFDAVIAETPEQLASR